MPVLTVNGLPCYYESEGEGFPLLLACGPHGSVAAWHPIMPLLGELCRTMAYEYREPTPPDSAAERFSSDQLAADVIALLDAIDIDRAYLAIDASAGRMAAHIAQHAATRLEGLILIGQDDAETVRTAPHTAARGDVLHPMDLETLWQTFSVPTLVVVGEQVPAHRQWAEWLVSHLPAGRQVVLPEAGQHPLLDQPRPLGHVMLQFLLHCERQRNLVRGASFLL